jgi:hypothetical protein
MLTQSSMTSLDVLVLSPEGSAATGLLRQLRGRGLSICVVDTEAEFAEVIAVSSPRAIIVPKTPEADETGDSMETAWAIFRGCDEAMINDDFELLVASLSRGVLQRVGDLEVDLSGHRVLVRGRKVRLTPTEFRLLEFLITNVDVVVSKPQILDNVVGYGGHDDNLVEVHISGLRRKLKGCRHPRIETVRGVGYVIRRSQAA